MPDPVTVGALVAATLSSAANAIGKDVVSPAVKDGYTALKGMVARWAAPNVEQLEQKPDSAARAAVVAEIVDDQPPEAQHELLTLAETLRAALQSEGKGEAVATMLNQFNNYGGQQFNAPGGTQNFGTMPPKASE